MFSRCLTNSAIISVLMWYFTFHGGHLVMSAILSNLQDSLSSLLVIFMANAADLLVGRFRTLLFSNTAYIGGLMLFWLFIPVYVEWLVVVALVLLALGTSGANLLEDVLVDLVDDIDNSLDKERSLARAAIWSRIAKVSGAISVTLWVAPEAVGGIFPSWRNTFLICIITMTAALLIFFIGYNFYHQDQLTERRIGIVLRVLCAGIQKLLKCNSWCLTDTSRQDGSPQNLETEENEGIPQERSLRLDTTGQEDRWNEDMVVAKSLLRMVLMWVTYLVVCLISATGSTFFLEQYSNLNTVNKIPIQIYNLVQDLSSFAIPFLYRWICGFRQNDKVKIGVGMLCAIISCVFAWQLEVHRLKVVKHQADQDANTSLSFLWLVPQFCVLGCMEGLTGEGLFEFFKSQIKDEPIRSFGKEYMEFVLGLGTLLNIFLILIFKGRLGWFSDTINVSRLDKYYRLLVCVCSVNFIIYCCIAKCFYKDAEQRQDSANDDSQQDDQEEP